MLNNKYQLNDNELLNAFNSISLEEILKNQNSVSKKEKDAFIWVLNTCVFFVPPFKQTMLQCYIICLIIY